MRSFVHLLRNEFRSLAFSPATHIAGVLFLVLMGLVYWSILKAFTLTPQEEPPPTQFFRVFRMPAYFVVPLQTKRSLAEERRQGTLQTLLTTPTRPLAVVLAKFCAVYVFYLVLWAATFAFPLIAAEAASMDQAVAILFDPPSLLGGFVFVALSGTLFVSMGIFCSSLTRSQLVAGMLCFTGLFLLIAGSRLLLEVPIPENGPMEIFGPLFGYLQTFEHLLDFSAGIIDTRPFVYYLSGTALFLLFSTILVERKA